MMLSKVTSQTIWLRIEALREIKKELYFSYPKTPIPKPSKNMYQTKRGKWVNCK